MLALATTQATVTGRLPGADVPTDGHGAPLPVDPPPVRGPYAAHRRAGVVVLTAAGTEARGAVWWLAPEADPVAKGHVITDARDGTAWVVEGAQLVPAGLGLQQVRADCTAQPAEVV